MSTPAIDRAYARFGKRLIDLALGGLIALLVLPLVLLVAALARLVQGAPILFRQVRPGERERLFTLVKFRTMATGDPGSSDAARLTRIGRFMRRWSLDELPSLWNVIRGDMSLVGPRPLLPEYLPRYDREQRRRHQVRPGLTGWAQVNGRNALTWKQKFEHDVWYVDHVRLALDLKILAMTLALVIRGQGISAPEHATMPKFEGNEND